MEKRRVSVQPFKTEAEQRSHDRKMRREMRGQKPRQSATTDKKNDIRASYVRGESADGAHSYSS